MANIDNICINVKVIFIIDCTKVRDNLRISQLIAESGMLLYWVISPSFILIVLSDMEASCGSWVTMIKVCPKVSRSRKNSL
jgi:hypothetical protein